MAEPIRQRRFQLVPTSSAIRRIRPRNHPSPLRQLHITDSQIQRHRQHRRLHSRRTSSSTRPETDTRHPQQPTPSPTPEPPTSHRAPAPPATPAKSDGSRNDPNTVLHNTPSAAANPRTKLDLPIPGPEINNDGTPARPFASNTVTAVARSAIRTLQKNRHDGQSRHSTGHLELYGLNCGNDGFCGSKWPCPLAVPGARRGKAGQRPALSPRATRSCRTHLR